MYYVTKKKKKHYVMENTMSKQGRGTKTKTKSKQDKKEKHIMCIW